MPKFKYIAMDAKGAEAEGVIDAENQNQAVSLIRTKGFFPTRVVEIGGGAPGADKKKSAVPAAVKTQAMAQGPGKKGGWSFGGTVKTKVLMVFTRQLATLVAANMPLLRGLRILLKQEKTPVLRVALSGMGEAVESGSTFSEALAQYPKIFDKLFINMVKAGEAGGVLDVVLERLAEFMEKSEKIKNKVKGAMIYPIVVLCAACGIVGFLMTNVIPKFQEIFKDLMGGKTLPGLTQFVINISNAVTHHGVTILMVAGGFIVGIKLWGKTAKGRLILDKMKLKMPLFGQLVVKASVARFTRTLGTLMSSGVPVLQALNIVRETSGNEAVAKAIQQVHDAVKEGESMSMPLEASGVFPGMVVSMVDVGEETGALAEMLTRIADNYEDEVDTAVEGLTSIIEPIMIVLLALVVGTIVIAMFVPLLSIIGEMSK